MPIPPYMLKESVFAGTLFYGGAEVAKLELIINKFIEKVHTFEMFEPRRMIDWINLRKIA